MADGDIPTCCGVLCRLTTGAEIYPGRPGLRTKNIYVCDRCKNYCGCHPGTTKSLGSPADKATRNARSKLHDLFMDPIWKNARVPADFTNPNKYRKIARSRVYAFVADKLGLDRSECHTGRFSLEQCRAAARALKGLTYEDIRNWAKANSAKPG